MHLWVKPGTSRDNKARVLDDLYRGEMKRHISELLGVAASAWGVKKMKTKLGSCNIQSQRIWLNLELAKKPPECLEFYPMKSGSIESNQGRAVVLLFLI